MNKTLSITALCATFLLTGCGKSEETNKAPVKTPSEVKIERGAPMLNPIVEEARTLKLPALINPNTASMAEMAALPGMPENIPALIEGARPFADAKALDAFLTEHANEPTKEAIYKVLFIPMALNTTPEKDFMIIPGVGKKMAHEFEEYRPYTDMGQFDREISKYVDAKELARLRRYVVIE